MRVLGCSHIVVTFHARFNALNLDWVLDVKEGGLQGPFTIDIVG